jgi:uncharacterized protein
MNHVELTRRRFIKQSIGAGIAIAGSPFLLACGRGYDAKALPTAVLGRTGVKVPKIALGLGSRFCTIDSEDEAAELLNYALDNGFYFWDTAHIYVDNRNGVVSEERLGKIIKDRRKEVFLSTKVTSRDPDEAMKQIELSLKRLQTDQVDVLKIHSVASPEDVENMSGKGQLIEIVHKMKEQGVARFIGFSGHGNAHAMKVMIGRGDFDTMLIAMNHWGNNKDDRRGKAIPAALEKGMGVMLMKAIRPKDQNPEFDGNELIRFALSLNGPAGLTLGMDSLDIVQKNLALLQNFKPMTTEEKSFMAQRLGFYFDDSDLEWMKHGYHDGYWG